MNESNDKNRRDFGHSAGNSVHCRQCGATHSPQTPCSPLQRRDGNGNGNDNGDCNNNGNGSVNGNNNGNGHEQYTAVEIHPPTDPLVGTIIGGKYQILSLIGQGGMSLVYKAKQQPINKIVAIKMLLAHLSQEEESVQRFFQEARAAGQLSHPNVVSVFDFGLMADKQPFLVMDCLEGDTLAQVLRVRQRLPYAEAIPIFIEICNGLAAAHEKGVVHRDIKPSNIVIQSLPGDQRVRIVDFGIAKMLDAESQHLTKTGEIFGSPLYMSPEQCEGRQLDGRSDVYSLGVVLYETLSGKRPLVGKTAIETLKMHVDEIPQSLQKIPEAGYIPLDLENVVFKMMAKDREKRFASILEVKQALERVAAGESKAISGNLQYVGREISRKAKVLTVAATLSIILIAGCILAYPKACSAIAQHEYESGKAELANSNLSAAESHLQSAWEYSRKAGDTIFESKSLSALIRAYISDGTKSAPLSAARKRRQEIIREELLRLDLNAASIGALSEDSDSLRSGSGTMRKVSVANLDSSVSDSLSAPVQSRAGDGKSDEPGGNGGTAGGMQSNLRQVSAVLPTNATAEESKTNRISAASRSSSKLELAERSYNLPLGGSSVVHGAKMKALKDSPSDQRTSNGISGSKYGDSVLAASSQNTTITDAKQSKSDGTQMVNDRRESTGAGFVTGLQMPLVQENSTDANPEQLDKFEVLSDLLVEQGKYKAAKESADRAISLYSTLNLKDQSELSKLYSTRAWCDFNLQRTSDCSADLQLANKLSNNAPLAVGQIESIQALLHLQAGKMPEAQFCFDKALQCSSQSNESSSVLNQAIKQYNSTAR